MGKKPLLFACLMFMVTMLQAQWKTVTNGPLWKDTNGKDIQAHGAGFLYHEGRWYMIGEDRSSQWNPDVNMYSSDDLVNWRFENKIIENRVTHPELGVSRFIERPKLLRNPTTGQFVVWCHWEQGNYGASEAAVFYSDVINGDYKFHWAGRPLGIKSRDCNVFQDNDGTAYFISTTSENTDLGLFRLSDDYLSIVEHTLIFDNQYREAPAIVRLGDTYYMISSGLTGWDPNQAKLSYSKSLKSGWSNLVNIGNRISFDTQAASILTVQGSEKTSYLYVGDRWQDPGLPASKTIMFPVSFSGNTLNFEYTHQFDLNIATGETRATPTTNFVSKANWKVTSVSSEETSGENGRVLNAIDGNKNTIWHTKYSGGAATHPHHVEVDMGQAYEVSGFLCTPRQDNEINGTIRNFQLFFSTDGQNWGAPVAAGRMPWQAEVTFQPVTARYFRLVALSEISERAYASIAELDVIQNRAFTPRTMTPHYRIDQGNWSTSSNITINKGSSLSFGPQTQPQGMGSWSWFGPNNLAVSQRELTVPNISLSNAGTYTALFMDQYNSMNKIDINVSVADNPLAVKDLENSEMRLHPNPVTSRQKLIITAPNPAQDLQSIKIIDIRGSILSETILKKGTTRHELNLTGLAPGLYLVSLEYSGNIIKRKFLVSALAE